MNSHQRKKYLNLYLNTVRSGLILTIIIFFSFCNSTDGKRHPIKNNLLTATRSGNTLKYDLDNPEEKYLLPDYLREISGIVYYYNGKSILCVQDNKANIYEFIPARNEIINKYRFGIDGDYEDITIAGQTVFVLRSDGTIFGIKDFERPDRKVTEYTTPLTDKNNTEGLAYDRLSNSLFIACKGSPEIKNEKQYKGYKAIYKFDLKEMKLNKEPVFLVDLNSPESYRDDNLLKEFTSTVFQKGQLIKSAASFKPSALAIDPLTDEIYLISSTYKILIILDRDGKILNFKSLDSNIFRQPEGICFSPVGDLFISSEGAGGKGYILKFKLLKGK